VRLWTVPVAGGGAVSVVARPHGDESLWSELEEIRATGVDVLVSMLERHELPISGLAHEELAAPAVGLRFFSVPTPDRSPPPSDPVTLALLAELALAVRSRAHVAVHCHAGHGRSPAFAAALLVMIGTTADDAMTAVSRARDEPVPHRAEQRDWVRWIEATRAQDVL